MDPQTLSLNFWGTRGLISAPNAANAIFGGNTSCIQLTYDKHLVVFDTGFGASNLGESLMPRITTGGEALEVHIFYTNFYWDHVQGLPFFHPIYFPKSTLNIYSPSPVEHMHSSLDVLFDGSYSPFAGIASMPSRINLRQLNRPFELDGLRISFAPTSGVRHDNNSAPEAGCAYRIENMVSGEVIAIVTGHEAGDKKTGPLAEANSRIIEFVRNADILVHDAQFTAKEYRSRIGWGHSSMEQAISNGFAGGVGRLLLTHHDPRRTDQDLQKLHRKLSQKSYDGVPFEFAREEHVYQVAARQRLARAG